MINCHNNAPYKFLNLYGEKACLSHKDKWQNNLDLAFVKTLFLNLYEEEPMLPFNTNN